MNIFRRKARDGTLLSPNYYLRFVYKGRLYIESTGTPDARLARKILSKRHTQAVEGKQLDVVKPKDVPTLRAYAQTYLNGYALRKRSRRCDQLMLDNSILPAFGSKRLNEIPASDVEAWRNVRLSAPKRRGEGTMSPASVRLMSPASVRLEMACLKTILNLAVRDGLIEVNPAHRVRLPRVNNRRDRVVTSEEYRRLLGAVKYKAPHIRPILVLGYETGMRLGEILGLRWQDLQRRQGFAYLAETKNGTSRWVPLNAAVRGALRGWPRRTDTDLVFAGPTGKPLTSLKTVWKLICERARVQGARFHDLRHTFTTRMLEAGVDIRTIMAITGHKDVAMFKRYSHPTDSRLQAAVEALRDSPLVSNLVTTPAGRANETRKSFPANVAQR